MGEVLAELRRRKLNGQLDGRESELAAARELLTGGATGGERGRRRRSTGRLRPVRRGLLDARRRRQRRPVRVAQPRHPDQDDPTNVFQNRRRLADRTGIDPERARDGLAAARPGGEKGVAGGDPRARAPRALRRLVERRAGPGDAAADCRLPPRGDRAGEWETACACRPPRRLARPHRRDRRERRRRTRRGPARRRRRPRDRPVLLRGRSATTCPFTERFGPDVVTERKLDLWRAAELALDEAGVAEVERTDLCTFCNPSSPSHRRERGITGRQGVIASVA